MAAVARSLIEEKWVCFECDRDLKLAPLFDRATVGGAASNAIVLEGRGLRSLHGQFLMESGDFIYRDFQDRKTYRVEAGEDVMVGPWKGMVKPFAFFQMTFEKQILDSFKVILKDSKGESLEASLQKLRQKFFLSKELPSSIDRLLRSQVSEISLSSPIERLLEDPDITDILVEDFNRIWIEKSGALIPSGLRYTNLETYEVYIENLLTKLHKTIDEAHPFLDFVLPDGSRGHLIVPPLTNGSRYLSIRKIRKDFFTLQDLAAREMFSAETMKVLESAISEQKNILISGATGSGKTTLLKAILQEIPKAERLVVIEDTSELQIPRENAAFLYSRIDVRGTLPAITLRDLVRQSLRMRPDRIIIGEVRGDEALDLMQAMNTGHRGCLGSLHANSARDALSRLQGLIQMSSAALSENAMRDLIARNIHLILHCGRNAKGARRILEYAFLRGLDQNQILLEVRK